MNPIQIWHDRPGRRSPIQWPSFITCVWLVTGAAALLLLIGCASAPMPPNEALRGAEQAIARAEQARVADYASPELGQARTKLTAARSAVERQDMVLARNLAEESRADAELASAKAEAVKAQAVNDEMKKSTETLKQEMQRNPDTHP